MMPDLENKPVLVVGAGPVGLLAAQLLAKSGLKTTLIEASTPETSISDDCLNEQAACKSPRAYALSPASIGLLQNLGIWQHLLAKHKPCPYRSLEIWDQNGIERIAFEGEDAGFPQLGYIVQHDILMHWLWKKARQTAHLNIITGQTPIALRTGTEESWLKLSSGEAITGCLIIGADGANSKVRTLAGLRSRKWHYQQTALVATAELASDHLYAARQVFTHQGTLGILPIGCENPRLVLLIWSLDDVAADALSQADDRQFRQQAAQAIELPSDQITAIWDRQRFPLSHCHARTWVKPGLALIGDAAHSIHPLAGQGLNLGFEDVATLTALIQQRIKNTAAGRHPHLADIALLKTYQRKRLSRTVGVIALIESMRFGFQQKTAIATVLRNRLLGLASQSSLFKSAIMRAASGTLPHL